MHPFRAPTPGTFLQLAVHLRFRELEAASTKCHPQTLPPPTRSLPSMLATCVGLMRHDARWAQTHTAAPTPPPHPSLPDIHACWCRAPMSILAVPNA
jgi:hypothetical protein